MARIHAIHAHNGCIPKPNLWIKMRQYFSLVATEFTEQASNIRWNLAYQFLASASAGCSAYAVITMQIAHEAQPDLPLTLVTMTDAIFP